MSIEEILKHDIFKQIDEAVAAKNYDKALGLLSMETPIEWTTLGTSEVNGQSYRYLPIEVLEAMMDRIFGYSQWYDESETNIIQTSNSATVTTTVKIYYGCGTDCFKTGVASVYVEDNYHWENNKIKMHTVGQKPTKALQMLTTTTPLSLTEAKKNAIKNIANIFGRNLNRNVVEALPEIPNDTNASDEQDETTIRFNEAIEVITNEKYKEAAQKRLEKDYPEFKYHTELKEIINAKK